MHSNGQNTTRAAPQSNRPREPRHYVVQHEFEGSAELTTTLVHAISDVAGVDVRAAEDTLNDYVDPDALNRLFGPKPDGTYRASSHVRFTVWGCDVAVFSDGRITIVPPASEPRPTGERPSPSPQ